MIEMTIELRIRLSVLDAAVDRCLPGWTRYLGVEGGVVEFQREQTTSGSVVYRICDQEPGDLGSVTVRELSTDKCELQIDGPRLPATRNLDEEELTQIRDIADKEERRREVAATNKKIGRERDELYEKRRDLQRVIVRAFWSSLGRERIWPEAGEEIPARATRADERRPGGRPGLEHEELIHRLAKAQEAEEIRSENPDMTWKEIAKDIDWRHGTNEPGLALLRDARRSRLGRLKKDDPHGLLQEVSRWRKEEEARKTKKT